MKNWMKMVPPYEGAEPYVYCAFAEADAAKIWKLLRPLLERGCRVWYCCGAAGAGVSSGGCITGRPQAQSASNARQTIRIIAFFIRPLPFPAAFPGQAPPGPAGGLSLIKLEYRSFFSLS